VRRTTVILKVVSRPEEIKPGKTVTWSDEIKDLPPVQPTRLGGGCKLIELKYNLTVRSVIDSAVGGSVMYPVMLRPSDL